MSVSKDAAARTLIEWHFQVEPELRTVYRMIAQNEDAEDEPIKLLEINEATVPTGEIEAFRFAGTDELPFQFVIAEITSDELEHLRGNPRAWPEGWDLDSAAVFERPKAA